MTFVSENFGASKLADQFGVKGYPAVFVDDVLVAAPRDFGYFGEVEGTGRYAPWRNADSQDYSFTERPFWIGNPDCLDRGRLFAGRGGKSRNP